MIRGNVNSENGAPVPYASVRLKHNSSHKNIIGTITNLDGYFELNLTNTIDTDSLIISHLEEGIYKSTIKNALALDSFRLAKMDKVLSEVVITPVKFSAKDTVKKAFVNYAQNHWTQNIQYNAFYREYGAQDNKWGRFFEAKLTLDNFGSLKLNENMRIIVEQARKSIDGFENTKDVTNPFFTLYRPLKFSLEDQQFRLVATKGYENQLVYLIEFFDGEYEGTLCLNTEDLSFVEIRAHLSTNGKNIVRNKGWGKIHDKIRRYKNFRRKNDLNIKFRPYKNKSYFYSVIVNGIWTAERKNDTVVYNYNTNFVVTGLTEEFEPITADHAIEKREDLLTNDYPYNESFWQHYNYMISDQKQQEILKHLTPIR